MREYLRAPWAPGFSVWSPLGTKVLCLSTFSVSVCILLLSLLIMLYTECLRQRLGFVPHWFMNLPLFFPSGETNTTSWGFPCVLQIKNLIEVQRFMTHVYVAVEVLWKTARCNFPLLDGYRPMHYAVFSCFPPSLTSLVIRDFVTLFACRLRKSQISLKKDILDYLKTIIVEGLHQGWWHYIGYKCL